MAYETVELQQILREIADRTTSEQDADAIRLAADALDAFAADVRHASGDVFAWRTVRGTGESEVVRFFGSETAARESARLGGATLDGEQPDRVIPLCGCYETSAVSEKGRGSVTQEPVAWAVLDSAGNVIHASGSRDACERGFADEEIEQGLSLAPLYTALPQDRVVRLPQNDWTNPAIVLKVMDALDAAGVKWKVAGE